MTQTLHWGEVERFRAAVAQRLALWFDDGKLDYLANVLERRLSVVTEPAADYLAKLEAPAQGQAELREIARELTVGETYFFRHKDQFQAFAEVALPERIAARASTRQLRLLSAGCSSGDEAYSLSILTRQRLPDPAWAVAITGIDVNPDILQRAKLARYSAWSLRETPADFQKRYFVVDGRDYVLDEAIRKSVEFRDENLIEDGPWLPGSLDIVFCRNVLMYFTPENAARAVQKLALALAPGGYLFLGSAETLRGLSEDFELCHTHSTFYYRRKGASATPSASAHTWPPPDRQPMPLELLNGASEWQTTVDRSLARITKLGRKPKTEEATPGAIRDIPQVDLGGALELLARERFGDALSVLEALVPSTRDTDALLLRAALLTHSGELAAAELVCTELLLQDSLSSGAHYLQALCRDRSGDAKAAVEHSQIASYLDPGFAMPHLHLGLMARRTGDLRSARRELSQASLLLQREEPARLLLFGGGFDRKGLIALCHSELEQLGERQ